MISVQVFSGKFSQLYCMFGNFPNKTLGEYSDTVCLNQMTLPFSWGKRVKYWPFCMAQPTVCTHILLLFFSSSLHLTGILLRSFIFLQSMLSWTGLVSGWQKLWMVSGTDSFLNLPVTPHFWESVCLKCDLIVVAQFLSLIRFRLNITDRNIKKIVHFPSEVHCVRRHICQTVFCWCCEVQSLG